MKKRSSAHISISKRATGYTLWEKRMRRSLLSCHPQESADCRSQNDVCRASLHRRRKVQKNEKKIFSIDKITKEEKKKILRKCCKKINFFTGKRMYDLRYEKSSKESLEKIWNKTI